MIWSFRDFVDGAGDNLILSWMGGLPLKARMKIDTRILYLSGIKVWPEQYMSALRGFEQLWELRIVCEGNQYRPIGCYGPGLREFTLLVGAIEKGKLPNRVIEVASERRRIVLQDRRRSIEHVYRRQTADSR